MPAVEAIYNDITPQIQIVHSKRAICTMWQCDFSSCRIASPRFLSWGCDNIFTSNLSHCDIILILRDFPGELREPIKNNEKWRQWARVGKFSYAVFEVVLLKILETNIRKDGTITHNDLFHAILQRTLENTLFE